MHKRVFQGLKRTFMHVSGLPSPYFDSKTNLKKNWFFSSNYGGGRPDTCINVQFSAGNATFIHVSGLLLKYFDFNKKPTFKIIGFLNQTMVGEVLRHA